MYEDDALAAVPFGPIDPVPTIGLTMRENWVPTKMQQSFRDLIQKRIIGSLTLTNSLNTKLCNMGLSFRDYHGETR
jgi:hypothetical protein